jgi:intracellular multiplication protein IcmS
MDTSLSKQLAAIAKHLDVKFRFNDKSMSHEAVFSTKGLLPGIARRADQLCSLCLGYGIGVVLDDAENTPLGIEVKFDEVTPETLRLLCIVDVLMELIKGAATKEAVSLDELMYD